MQKSMERRRDAGRMEGVNVLIAKKKGAKETGEHRGITLLPTAYKIYASVVANRLKKR